MKALSLTRVILISGIVVLAACSEDTECPTCPKCDPCYTWVKYDNFDDNELDTELWIEWESYGGRVYETNGQLQVWGHDGAWTGRGTARAVEPKLAWRFDLIEEYHEDGPGCQGWHIAAIDTSGTAVEGLNHCNAGCTNPPNWGDGIGSYEVRIEGDSLAVYLNDNLLRRVFRNDVDFFVMQFSADNVYGSGHHCHIFIDGVWGLEKVEQ